MGRISLKLHSYARLGLRSLASYFLYSTQCRFGFFEKINKPTFDETINSPLYRNDGSEKYKRFSAEFTFFFNDKVELDIRDFSYYNPYSQSFESAMEHWSKIKSTQVFKPGKDIKVIWEQSRFYWLVEKALNDGKIIAGDRINYLNSLLHAWSAQNPMYIGIGWLCAQETAIRLFNFLLSFHLLNIKPTDQQINFAIAHGDRIRPALGYAVAQKNNHSISEALGMYALGAWLHGLGVHSKQAKKFINLGHHHLEKQVARLVLTDGTFSQYSITYHCLVVELVTAALWLRKKHNLPEFSFQFKQKCRLLLDWLMNFIDPVSHNAPNMGSNDSTALYKLDDLPYRDFRTRIQTLSVLLTGVRAYDAGPWDKALNLLGVDSRDLPVESPQHTPNELRDGGFVKFVGDDSWAFLNYPKFKFRPSQADCMHIDLWVCGVNVLRDNGTYSYNSAPELRDYFRGVEAHNTIQFDNKQPMPMVSRFLFGDWVKTKVEQNLSIEKDVQRWCGVYKTSNKNIHRRCVECYNTRYIVTDEISRFEQLAILRWHLSDAEWLWEDGGWVSDLVKISVEVNGGPVKPILYQTEQSLYYHSKHKKPAIRVEIKESPAIVVTRIEILV